MKIIKKVFVAALALLIVVMPLNVFADDNTTISTGDHSIDVQAKYVDSTSTTDVYSVDVVWGAMQFTYNNSGTKEWDPSSHQYTDSVSGSWTAQGNEVKVTNHSNKDVTVEFSFATVSGFEDISGAFTVASEKLDAGEVGNVAGAKSVTTALTLSGTLADNTSEFTKVGTITVSIK